MRLIRVSVENYKSISSLQELTDLRTANAIIGPNNQGKSTFLEAVMMAQYLTSDIKGNAAEAENYMLERLPGKSVDSGLEIRLFFKLEVGDFGQDLADSVLSCAISWSGLRVNRPYRVIPNFEPVHIEIDSPGLDDPIVIMEWEDMPTVRYDRRPLAEIFASGRQGNREQISIEDIRNRCNELPLGHPANDDDGYEVLRSIGRWSKKLVYVPSYRQIDVVGTMDPRGGPLNGTSLPSILSTMRTNEYDTFTDFENIVKQLVPSVRGIFAHNEGGQGISIRVSDRDDVRRSENAYRLDTVGSGVNEIIYLVAAVWLSPPGSVCLIEEPERGLHAGSQRLFMRSALEHAKQQGKQLLWATHSPIMAPISDDWSVHIVVMDDARHTTSSNVAELSSAAVLAALGHNLADLYSHDILVVVDGDTETAALPAIARFMLGNYVFSAIHFWPLRGDIGSKKELMRDILRLLKPTRIRVLILADNDERAEQTKNDLLREFEDERFSAQDLHLWDCRVEEKSGGARRAEFEDNFSLSELTEAGNRLAERSDLSDTELDLRMQKSPTTKTSKVLADYYAEVYGEQLSKPKLGELLGQAAIRKIEARTSRGFDGAAYEFEGLLDQLSRWIS